MTEHELKQEAEENAEAKGHNLVEWEALSNNRAHNKQFYSYCIKCTKGVHVQTNPPGEELDVHGLALEDTCVTMLT